MDIKQTLKKVKANKYAFVGTSALGSLMVGIGITGVAMSPSYVYVVGGISGNFNSKSAAEAWLKKDGIIAEHEVHYRSVGGEFLIPVEEWGDYVFSIYTGLFGDNITYLTDQDITKNQDTGEITTVVNARTEADYITIYKDSLDTIELDQDAAIASFLKNVSRFSNSFTGSSFNSHFETALEAEQDWEDQTVSGNTYDSRTEYQYDGSTWNHDQTAARDAVIAVEEAKITHTAAIAATPGTEGDYQASSDYIDDRDEWILDNDGSDEAGYLASPEYTSNRDSWITANPDFGNTGADEYWTYDSTDYPSLSSAESAVSSFVDSQRQIRTMWSHDGTLYDYSSRTEAQDAFRLTLDKTNTSTEVVFFYSDGSINVAHNTDQTTVEDGIEARLSSKEGFATATGDYDSYAITSVHKYEYNTPGDVYYDSTESIADAFEIDSNIQYTEVVEHEYYLSTDDEKTMFDTEDEAFIFWATQIRKIKE